MDHAAAGINHLPLEALAEFIRALGRTFGPDRRSN